MKLIFQVVFIFSLVHYVCAQESPSDKLTRYFVNTLQEKVFLHLDRNAYIAGEICWFKMYNVDATLHKPLELNKVGYVEIINNKNIPVLQTKILLSEGTGKGSLNLPVSMPTGYYTIRAQLDEEFSCQFLFRKANSYCQYFKIT